ncbi:hypothetical protein GCM10018790_34710 [Kitasatospora xanthocidica]|uniref:hypothetical protein n=1 Tax=Kitasatospora xanthocidica TaxID=83382 RepID=UPI00167B2CD3|nr:hypothetical protein [Kitasatospora xanthocidica]GHF53896.1 hypothetical protein GCM10018790_34710 [Kitasatospora xanthocidica]
MSVVPESAVSESAVPESAVPDLQVLCPLCKVAADPASLCCPSCREDLSVLFRLRYAGRIDFNRALEALRNGDAAAAAALLRAALAAEPELEPARELLESLSVAGPGGPDPVGREGDTPSE